MHGCSNYKPQGINRLEIVVQLVRTPACQAGGREFKSRRSRNIKAHLSVGFYFYIILLNIIDLRLLISAF